jgi:ribosomal-protein-alanine N-acetyltransferase
VACGRVRHARGVLTERFLLRRFDSCDVDDLHAIFADPLTNTIGDGPFTAIDQTRDWIAGRERTRAEHGYCWYGIRDRARRELLGNCGIFAGRTGPREPELGYMVAAARRGEGIAYEAAASVLAEALAGVSRVWATIRPHNTISPHIAGKLGFVERRTENDERGALVFLARDASDRPEGHGAQEGRAHVGNGTTAQDFSQANHRIKALIELKDIVLEAT